MNLLNQIKDMMGLVESHQAKEPNDRQGHASQLLKTAVADTLATANEIVETILSTKDEDRQRAIRATGLLDSEADEIFDGLALLVCKSLNVDTSLISLIDTDRQYIVSKYGITEDMPDFTKGNSWPLATSYCKFVVEHGEPLIVEDAREHPITKGPQAELDGLAMSYIGYPIVVNDDVPIGAVCAFGDGVHNWTRRDQEVIGEITVLINRLINLKVLMNS